VNRDAAAKQGMQSIILAPSDSSDKEGTMKQNDYNADRVVRAIVGVVLLGLGLFSRGSMTLGMILDI
jgi:hypothetical protein